MADLTDLRPGDRVRVTRTGERGTRSVWEGVLLTVTPGVGFSLKGHHMPTGEPEHGYFCEAEILCRTTRCEQTIELLERPGQVPECRHGSPARHITLVDRDRQCDTDPYGDVDGPVAVEHLAAMKLLLRERSTGAEEGRHRLALLHADRCRTER